MVNLPSIQNGKGFNPDRLLSHFIRLDFGQFTRILDAVGSESAVSLASDVEKLAEFIDGERSRNALTWEVTYPLQFSRLRMNSKPDNTVPPRWGISLRRVAVREVEEKPVGCHVQIGRRDTSPKAVGLRDEILNRFEHSLFRFPLPNADSGWVAFIRGVGDWQIGVKDQMARLPGFVFTLRSITKGGVLGSDQPTWAVK